LRLRDRPKGDGTSAFTAANGYTAACGVVGVGSVVNSYQSHNPNLYRLAVGPALPETMCFSKFLSGGHGNMRIPACPAGAESCPAYAPNIDWLPPGTEKQTYVEDLLRAGLAR
jgi:hypothetical protein